VESTQAAKEESEVHLRLLVCEVEECLARAQASQAGYVPLETRVVVEKLRKALSTIFHETDIQPSQFTCPTSMGGNAGRNWQALDPTLAALTMQALEALDHTEAVQAMEAKRLADTFVTEPEYPCTAAESNEAAQDESPVVEFHVDYNSSYQPFNQRKRLKGEEEEKEFTPPFESRQTASRRRPSIEPTPFKQLHA
jgi:hypothetical protein